ncbi:ribonuclease HepT family protein [Campylobacter helveticus]|uniref:hypothetical protein n=1 Tax=Campylobacter helveticus TaxID=28898 RepID=UPI0009C2EB5F|nr:hypothetical protein [Campylobacter helveticus]ARE80654.1 hypothetical protein CHELV3228_1066 [Campylobacter helveticus]MCR2059795.1 hypothetical protein [Campylobacter helveticus]TNH34799.1 ABC transporter permease [Campylobacter helveticus]TNH35048.1 ABC transporter permease [Campylobacter helveticus]TXK51615.1 ABC transporter permease [Campylobacter helveticus]
MNTKTLDITQLDTLKDILKEIQIVRKIVRENGEGKIANALNNEIYKRALLQSVTNVVVDIFEKLDEELRNPLVNEIKFSKATRNFIAHNDKELNLKKVYNFIKYKFPKIESYIKMNFGLGEKAKVCKRKSNWSIAVWVIFFVILGGAITCNFLYWNLSDFFGLFFFIISSIVFCFIASLIFAMLFALIRGNTYALSPRATNTNDYFWYYRE